MKITRLESLYADGGWRTFCFLKVSTDEGLTGWSEYSDNYGAGGVSDLIQRFGKLALGRDPRDIARLSADFHAVARMAAGGVNTQAAAAIENACLDIKAKALGVPVHALFGGRLRDRLAVYWSHCGFFRVRRPDLFEQWGRPPIRSLEDLKRLGEEAVARGFKAVKTNPLFFESGKAHAFSGGFAIVPGLHERNPDGKLVRAVTELLAAFRDGMGPDAGLHLDINFSQRPDGFRRLAKAIEKFNLSWFEIDIHDAEALASVRRSTSTPIASLETIYGLSGYRPFFERYAVDAAVVDVIWNGLYQSMRIAALADAFEVNVAPHNFYGPLANLISAHFSVAVPNFRIMEIEVEDVPWKDELISHPGRIETGDFVFADRPGWGAEVNEEAVRAHPPMLRG